MKTRGAVIHQAPGKYEVVDLDVDEPRQGELRVRMVAAGLCHSDDHLATGDLPAGRYPVAGGHEGAGVVESVGPHTPDFEVGDNVVLSFVPSCGRCRWCAGGRPNLCDLGTRVATGARLSDPASFRLKLEDGTPVGQMCSVSTFCEHTTVAVESAVKVPKGTPLDKACLLSCSVGTGWGSAVRAGGVRPGDTVIVAGAGGVGVNALQGAAHAGATTVIAVDPVAGKRDAAKVFGATHAVSDLKEAGELAKSRTHGHGADVTIVTIGVVSPEHLRAAYFTVRKQGTLVLTGLGNMREAGIPIPLGHLVLSEKVIRGSVFGSSNPRADIPRMLELYGEGRLLLDELVTAEYGLDDIAKGYEDMHAGKNIRGIIRF